MIRNSSYQKPALVSLVVEFRYENSFIKSGCDLGAILVQKCPYLSIYQTKKAPQKREP